MRLPLACIFIACASVALAHEIPKDLSKAKAGEFRNLTEDLALEQLRHQIEAKKLEIENARKSAAVARKEIADANLEAAKAQSAALLAARPSLPITIEFARVELISQPNRACDATAFVNWQCLGGDPSATPPKPADKCDFVVDENVCALPAAATQPMQFVMQYSCGTKQIDLDIPFGAKAYLNCRNVLASPN